MPISFMSCEARLGVEEGVDAGHRDHLPDAGRGVGRPTLAALGDVVCPQPPGTATRSKVGFGM